MFQQPNPKKLAFDRRAADRAAQTELAYKQHATPQERYLAREQLRTRTA